MKLRKVIAVVLIVLGVFSLLGCGVKAVLADRGNRDLENGFTQKKYAAEDIYRNGAPLETIDFTQTCRYAFSWGSGGGIPYTEEISYFELPCDISYYATQEDADAGTSPVLVLKKGEKVAVAFDNGSEGTSRFDEVSGYGFNMTHPTYEAGWRFARPFLTKEQAADVTAEQVEAMAGCFVSTKELDRAASAYYNDVLQYDTDTSTLFYNIDQSLYLEEKFLAPSVYAPLWDGWSTALSVLGVLLIAAGIVLLCSSRSRKSAR